MSALRGKRLAIVGGGMGGVATAWFCDGEWSVSLFEAKEKLGGNCDSETVSRRDLVVDLGAQFFHPGTHPTYIALLELLEMEGAVTAGRAKNRFQWPGELCVLPLDGGDPYFSSTHVIRTPLHALDFVVYCQAARKMAYSGSYDVTIGDWVDELKVSQRFKSQILLPWLTASEGHPLEDTKRSSARAILKLFAPSHPRNPLKKATTWGCRRGFQGNLAAMAKQCRDLVVQTKDPVLRVEKAENSWFVHTSRARSGPFDAVVVNAPPWESKKLLGRMTWAEDLVNLLDRFEHRSHRLTIHTDPTYMHKDRRYWGLANVGIEAENRNVRPGERGESSELSIWMGAGAAFDASNDKAADVFKSWTTYRTREPKEILFERTFQHSVKTPKMMEASRQLSSWQGKEGLWFAGHFTSGIDLQESALRSAMDIGASLSPASPRLAALRSRMMVAV